MFLLAALLLVTFGIGTVSALTWQAEVVESAGDSGYDSSLALDRAGNPCISYLSYTDRTNSGLKYAAYNGSGWRTEPVDMQDFSGGYPSLALDAADNPRISYCDSSDLKYAAWDGSAWRIETVDLDGDIAGSTSLALDSAGNPHISYYDESKADLKYAAYNGSAWRIETVDSDGDVGEFSSLALDGAGNPHVGYYDYTNGDQKYASRDETGWHDETVDSAGRVGEWTSLALDSAGDPRISYYDATNADLKYAAWNGSAWQNETVDSAGRVGTWLSLGLDGGDTPHIAYMDFTNKDLKYAARKGSTWQNETVDSAGDVGFDMSLKLDGAGTPHISYMDFANKDLKYARVVRPPVGGFTADTTTGTAPLTVRFTDASLGVIDSRSWDFGDGGTSTARNPTHTFSDAGSYTVILTVTNIAGTNSTTQTVNVGPRPWIAADFEMNTSRGFPPFAVKFTDRSAGPVLYRSWEFGDGGTSTAQNPVHTYTKVGTYTVRLLVSDHQTSASRLRTVTVMDAPPPVGGDRGYFLVSTNPINATIYLEDISGTRYEQGTTADGPLNVTICLTCMPMRELIASKPGYRDAVFEIAHYPPRDMTVPVELVLVQNAPPGTVTVPGGTGVPGDLDGDGVCEDVNGNGRKDFADVVLYFNQMTWIAVNEPMAGFDYNDNGRIDFADVVWLFDRL